MPKVSLAVIRPFELPPKGAQLIVFSDIRNYVAQWDTQALLKAAVRYARTYGVYLVPNRFIADDFLSLCMIGPTGEILGGQRAVCLNVSYRGFLRRSDDLEIFDTPLGRIFLAVDVDLYRPEVIRAAALSGAQLVIGSRFVQGYDDLPLRRLCGGLNMAISNGVFVLDVSNMSCSLASPGLWEAYPDGFVARDCEDLPFQAVIDTDLAAGFGEQRQLSEEFYRRYQEYLGR